MHHVEFKGGEPRPMMWFHLDMKNLVEAQGFHVALLVQRTRWMLCLEGWRYLYLLGLYWVYTGFIYLFIYVLYLLGLYTNQPTCNVDPPCIHATNQQWVCNGPACSEWQILEPTGSTDTQSWQTELDLFVWKLVMKLLNWIWNPKWPCLIGESSYH